MYQIQNVKILLVPVQYNLYLFVDSGFAKTQEDLFNEEISKLIYFIFQFKRLDKISLKGILIFKYFKHKIFKIKTYIPLPKIKNRIVGLVINTKIISCYVDRFSFYSFQIFRQLILFVSQHQYNESCIQAAYILLR